MCGICGAIDFRPDGDATALVRRMTPSMVHRGPDDEGYLDAILPTDQSAIRNPQSAIHLALGMRRLSIIDLAGGHQPIFNEDGSVGVVLNGEIYNFQKLQQQLEALGHKFRTRADSEVIAHAYEEWGADCVQHLEGMFAIAVYDKRRPNGSSGFRVSSFEFQSEGRRAEGEEQRVEARNRDACAGKLETRNSKSETPTLFLARDRLGIKPLYYYQSKVQRPKGKVQSPTSNVQRPEGDEDFGHWTLDFGQFLFASEVRTLLASGMVPRRLSSSALQSYLLFGSVSEPMTLVEGVFSLPPGHTLTINLDSTAAAIEPQQYWNIAETRRRADPPSGRNGQRAKGEERQELKSEIGSQKSEVSSQEPESASPFAPSASRFAPSRVRELLEESIRLHLIADVPVGVFLSGGIDSTSIAALASRAVTGVHTFTVAFAEEEFSEATVARRTAQKFGTKHDELLIKGEDLLARLAEAVGSLDQPSMDGINTYFVSWAAGQAGLKVALSGLGGDELFGGYESTFRWTPRYERIASASSHLPGAIRSAMGAAMAGVAAGMARGDAAKKIAALWKDSNSLPHPYYFARALFAPPQVSELLRKAQKDCEAPWWSWLNAGAEQARSLDDFAAVTCLESRAYLVNTLLRDTDSMSMAHSLEVRVPFLHHPLVEFVAQLPAEVKLGNGSPKALLVTALKDLLPAEVVQQSKRGFTFPWQQWLRGPLKEEIEKSLAAMAPALRDVLDEEKVRGVWRSYLEGKTSWSRPWSLYVLNEWVKRNL